MPLAFLLAFAAVQGLTELLPVSSTGHLQLLWAWADSSGAVEGLPSEPFPRLGLEIAAHLGTLAALLAVVARDVARIAVGLARAARSRRSNPEARLALVLALATAPLFAAGWLLRGAVADLRGALLVVAWANVAFALLLALADRFALRVRRLDHLTAFDGIFVGVAQSLALVPGVSRSGAAITAARLLSCERAEAARLSLLLGAPAILGAAGAAALEHGRLDADPRAMAAVAAVSFAFALPSALFLLRWTRRRGYGVFVAWRLLLGAAVFAWLLAPLSPGGGGLSPRRAWRYARGRGADGGPLEHREGFSEWQGTAGARAPRAGRARDGLGASRRRLSRRRPGALSSGWSPSAASARPRARRRGSGGSTRTSSRPPATSTSRTPSSRTSRSGRASGRPRSCPRSPGAGWRASSSRATSSPTSSTASSPRPST